MKLPPAITASKALLFLLFLAMGLFSGCSTISSRIEEKSATFAALDASTQDKIRQGRVEVGFTTDMVYMALGGPSEVKDRATKQGSRLTWIYTSSYDEYAGTAHVGYRRRVFRDPHSGAVAVYLEPVYSNVYREQVQEDIRIIFLNGKVSVIEQAKR